MKGVVRKRDDVFDEEEFHVFYEKFKLSYNTMFSGGYND